MGFFNFGKSKEPLYNQRATEENKQQAAVPRTVKTMARPAAAAPARPERVDEQIAYGIDYLDERMNELTQAEAGIAEYVHKMNETYAGIGQVNEDFTYLNEHFNNLEEYAQNISTIMHEVSDVTSKVDAPSAVHAEFPCTFSNAES